MARRISPVFHNTDEKDWKELYIELQKADRAVENSVVWKANIGMVFLGTAAAYAAVPTRCFLGPMIPWSC